jgi:hypothetical protein
MVLHRPVEFTPFYGQVGLIIAAAIRKALALRYTQSRSRLQLNRQPMPDEEPISPEPEALETQTLESPHAAWNLLRPNCIFSLTSYW